MFTHSLTELIDDYAVYRKAPATLGLLKTCPDFCKLVVRILQAILLGTIHNFEG
jgi:hypothetical protein